MLRTDDGRRPFERCRGWRMEEVCSRQESTMKEEKERTTTKLIFFLLGRCTRRNREDGGWRTDKESEA